MGYGSLFHQHFEDNLKKIIDATDAKIVITSTWRADGLSKMQHMWKHRNLAGEVIDITPIFLMRPEQNSRIKRGVEIQEWINKHNIAGYVIIDDDGDMLESQLNNFVQCFNPDHEDKI